jgi:hypothetical protein
MIDDTTIYPPLPLDDGPPRGEPEDSNDEEEEEAEQ